MKIAKVGSDYITVNEKNMKDKELVSIPRVHLIKLDFESPTKEKVKGTMEIFSKTNRFVIDKFIRVYNDILKSTTKKFYVENRPGQNLISFFRKNNKVLLNVTNLCDNEREFILGSQGNHETFNKVLPDVLKNIEVIQVRHETFKKFEDIFQNWRGNVIIDNRV